MHKTERDWLTTLLVAILIVIVVVLFATPADPSIDRPGVVTPMTAGPAVPVRLP